MELLVPVEPFELDDGRVVVTRPASVSDLIAVLQQEGGEIVEAVFSEGESVPSIPVTSEGPYLVVRIDGEET